MEMTFEERVNKTGVTELGTVVEIARQLKRIADIMEVQQNGK